MSSMENKEFLEDIKAGTVFAQPCLAAHCGSLYVFQINGKAESDKFQTFQGLVCQNQYGGTKLLTREMIAACPKLKCAEKPVVDECKKSWANQVAKNTCSLDYTGGPIWWSSQVKAELPCFKDGKPCEHVFISRLLKNAPDAKLPYLRCALNDQKPLSIDNNCGGEDYSAKCK